MPRTKIKNSKRNREAANREEKIRLSEMKLDAALTNIDHIQMKYINDLDAALAAITALTKSSLLQMKCCDFLAINLNRFDEYKPQERLTCASSIASIATGQHKGVNCKTRSDEGYLTEDSVYSIPVMGGGLLPTVRTICTPGPLSSARARRARRSRSATSGLPTPNPTQISRTNSEHTSRSKLRTPQIQRLKAYSADRTSKVTKRSGSPETPPAVAYLRWPRPGEMAISKFGSPLVAQVMPDKTANINIPIKDGVMSLRPKKLENISSDLVENIDPKTIEQIRTLRHNLDVIMSFADKSSNSK